MTPFKFNKETMVTNPVHPGALLHDEIEYRGISTADLAADMNVDATLLEAVVNGKSSVTADIALKLERVLGVDAYYWMRIQGKFDIDDLRLKEFKKNPELLNNSLTGSAIALEPKSAYASLSKRTKTIE
jgi:addiction module HigA family antidote